MITGVKFMLNGVEREVPPLNIKQLKSLKAEFKALDALKKGGDQDKLTDEEKTALEDESFNATLRIVHAAVQRNYPEYTLETAEVDIDMENMADLVQAALGHGDLVEGKRKARALATSTGTKS